MIMNCKTLPQVAMESSHENKLDLTCVLFHFLLGFVSDRISHLCNHGYKIH